MTGEIRIGFSMHPRWAEAGKLEDFVKPLRQAGLSFFEFELDNHLEDWSEFVPLMESTFQMGLGLSFHAPYRHPHTLNGFAGSACTQIKDDYRPVLALAETWAQKSQKCRTVVIHAAVAKEPADRKFLIADTQAFLLWVLEEFPDLQLALENNHPARPGEIKVGVNPDDVLALINSIHHPRLGACWDMGHDFLRHSADEPSQDWIKKVVHIHVHDVASNGEDHFPLIFGRVPYIRWLAAWKELAGGGGVVLELKGNHLQNWSPAQIETALKTSIFSLSEVLK